MFSNKTGILLLSCLVLCAANASADPPFGGTIFMDPDIITESDYSTFRQLTYTGRGMRTMFDRRVNNWVQLNAYLFLAKYEDGVQIEIQANPEFGSIDAARAEAEFYAPVFGRLPAVLLSDVQTSWIHKGDEAFGGGNDNLLIHTGSVARGYIDGGILEETLVHEAAHTSLDLDHAGSPGWIAAQQDDNEFISDYARDFPQREDIAESFLAYIAVRHRPDRISAELEATIRNMIPGRLDYFETQNLRIHPLGDPAFAFNAGLNDAWASPEVPLQGMLLTVFPVLKLVFLAWFTFDTEAPAAGTTAVFGAPGQRWVTAAGGFDGNRAALQAELTSGGLFNSSTPVPSQNTDYGSILLEFSGCDDAVASFDLPTAALSGAFSIHRAAGSNIALCESLAAD